MEIWLHELMVTASQQKCFAACNILVIPTFHILDPNKIACQWTHFDVICLYQTSYFGGSTWIHYSTNYKSPFKVLEYLAWIRPET